MSLDFVIIPVTKTLENSAYNIRNKLNSAVKIPITIDLDINYKFPLNNRISKWRKNHYDIVVVDHDFPESNTVMVRFLDKGSRSKKMNLDVFIDLVTSFEDSDRGTDSGTDSGKGKGKEKERETDDSFEYCVIM